MQDLVIIGCIKIICSLFPWIVCALVLVLNEIKPQPRIVPAYTYAVIGWVGLSWERNETTPGMNLPPKAVPHISHHECVIPDVLGIYIISRAKTTPNSSSALSCLFVGKLTTSSSSKSTCSISSLNSISQISSISDMLVINHKKQSFIVGNFVGKKLWFCRLN